MNTFSNLDNLTPDDSFAFASHFQFDDAGSWETSELPSLVRVLPIRGHLPTWATSCGITIDKLNNQEVVFTDSSRHSHGGQRSRVLRRSR